MPTPSTPQTLRSLGHALGKAIAATNSLPDAVRAVIHDTTRLLGKPYTALVLQATEEALLDTNPVARAIVGEEKACLELELDPRSAVVAWNLGFARSRFAALTQPASLSDYDAQRLLSARPAAFSAEQTENYYGGLTAGAGQHTEAHWSFEIEYRTACLKREPKSAKHAAALRRAIAAQHTAHTNLLLGTTSQTAFRRFHQQLLRVCHRLDLATSQFGECRPSV